MAEIITQLRQHFQEPLYKNSYFLIGRSASTALLGVLFWIIAARFYPADEVGLAIALISAISLLGMFSRLGLDFGLIRYLPHASDQTSMLNSSFTIVGLFSLLLAMVFVAGLGLWSPALLFVHEDIPVLLLFIVATPIYSLWMLQSSAFVGLRSAKFSFVQGIIATALRIPLPIVLVSLGVLGIFASWGIASCMAVMAAFLILLPRVISGYHPVPTIKKQVINEIVHFSAGNYVADSFGSMPALLLPLIIVNVLGAEMGAYFYMAWACASLIFTIPVSIAASLLAEGSYDPNRFRKDVIRATKLTFIVLIPAVLGVLILGDKLLLLFGSEYSENALRLLWLLALAAIPLTVTRVYVTIKRMQLRISPIIFIYVFTATSTLAASYILMVNLDLLGVGIAWLAVQGTVAAVVGWLVIRKERWMTPKVRGYGKRPSLGL